VIGPVVDDQPVARAGVEPAAAEERGVQVFDLAELLEMSVAYSRPAAVAAPADPPEPTA